MELTADLLRPDFTTATFAGQQRFLGIKAENPEIWTAELLNADLFREYVQYIADRRLERIGLPRHYRSRKPGDRIPERGFIGLGVRDLLFARNQAERLDRITVKAKSTAFWSRSSGQSSRMRATRKLSWLLSDATAWQFPLPGRRVGPVLFESARCRAFPAA
jgi:hypothetical protein